MTTAILGKLSKMTRTLPLVCGRRLLRMTHPRGQFIRCSSAHAQYWRSILEQLPQPQTQENIEETPTTTTEPSSMSRLANVLITDPVNPVCVQILQDNNIEVTYKPKLPVADILKEIERYDGLIVRSGTKVTSKILEAAKRMKIVGRAGTGVDNIDCDSATRNGVIVMNTPAGNTMSATEHTCAMIMSLTRDIPRACASLKTGCWERSSFMGNEVFGKTLAVVGLGRIGREVATRMQAFGMRTIGYDPIIPAEVAKQFGVEAMSLEEIWPQADFVTVHTPLMPETTNLINDAVFACCRPGLRIVNVARGGIIDEEALLRALEAGKCAGAALDVFSEEPPKDMSLIKHPRVVCTPHLGANTHEAQTRVAEEIAMQFVDYAQGRDLVGVVNAPNLSAALRPENRSWVELSQSLGKLVVALIPGSWQNNVDLTVTTHGPGFEKLADLLKTATLVGILGQVMKNGVNLINAPLLAEEQGVKITAQSELSVPAQVAWTRAVSVEISIKDFKLRLLGTANGNSFALCRIDGASFPDSVPLSGRLLFFKAGESSISKLVEDLSGLHVPVSAIYCASPAKSWWAVSIPDAQVSVTAVKPDADVFISPL